MFHSDSEANYAKLAINLLNGQNVYYVIQDEDLNSRMLPGMGLIRTPVV